MGGDDHSAAGHRALRVPLGDDSERATVRRVGRASAPSALSCRLHRLQVCAAPLISDKIAT